MSKQQYHNLVGSIRNMHRIQEDGDETRVVASSDPNSISEPTKAKKKTPEQAAKDDPNTITIGVVTPVDLNPTTDQIKTADLTDKKDKKIVEEKSRTIGKGIHFGNYHRSIRKRVMSILKTNQSLADQHEIRPKEGQKANEETIDEMTKPENERVDMYKRAGHAESDNKHKTILRVKKAVKKLKGSVPWKEETQLDEASR